MKEKSMTLPDPFQTELNRISAKVKQALIHKYEEMHSHPHKGGKILSSSNQARYLQD